jgi:hypothetical protein
MREVWKSPSSQADSRRLQHGGDPLRFNALYLREFQPRLEAGADFAPLEMRPDPLAGHFAKGVFECVLRVTRWLREA